MAQMAVHACQRTRPFDGSSDGSDGCWMAQMAAPGCVSVRIVWVRVLFALSFTVLCTCLGEKPAPHPSRRCVTWNDFRNQSNLGHGLNLPEPNPPGISLCAFRVEPLPG